MGVENTVPSIKMRLSLAVGLVALCAAALVFYETGSWRTLLDWHSVHVLFQGIVWDGIPFIAIGALLAAMIESWLSSGGVVALLSDNLAGRLAAAMIGTTLPVCDCGAMPVARTLRRKGVGESIAFTFVLAAPTLNIVSLAATFIAFHQHWRWLAIRAGAALAIAVATGWIVRIREDGLTEKWRRSPSFAKHSRRGAAAVLSHASGEMFAVGPFFVASALLAAMAQNLLSVRAVTAFTQHSVWSIAFMMGVGGALSLCSTADAFVAASLAGLFSPGAILAFLLMGQMVDLRNVFMLPQAFGRRTVTLGLAVATVMIFAAALMVNLWLTGGLV